MHCDAQCKCTKHGKQTKNYPCSATRLFCVIMSKRKTNPKWDEYKEKMSNKRTGRHDEGSCSGNVDYITVQRLSSTVEGKCQKYSHIGALTIVPLGCEPTLSNIKTACTNHFNLQEMECDLLAGEEGHHIRTSA